ncbi:MAG: FAD-dependent oxidoreductase [Planktomarina sp.]|nr:FAD-dependent oxidoreductase [Planktomarina sp.]MDT2040342.1 FAD-dependent oxidoreductase [Planktomarina sp.]MDT2049523.1 FAD-dependent oxidoreductase [Planktomarina sp.]|tara:strand:- start:374 stop:1672 length:1299 start_codon:yes stop_codon:yes gene_type:complete
MPFENIQADNRRIAIIGGGISGMGAAYELRNSENVVLFESSSQLGGHARTVLAGKSGNMPVDTGFLVYNDVNYPHLTNLFGELEVPTIPSDMSFGASIDGGWLEYGVLAPKAIIAQKRNILRPKFLGMMRDILKFNKLANKSHIDPNITIGSLIKNWELGDWFRDYYLTPFTGAIWSTPVTQILDFPALPMIKFMKNHALLGTGGQHDWRTVKGGSREYVRRLEGMLLKAGVEIRLSTSVNSVRRVDGGVEVKVASGEYEPFDEVIFATHSDTTLGMLSDPNAIEKKSLDAIKYQSNTMVLHADTSIMPKRKAAWASWVYTEDKDKKSDRIDLTYWINRLQSLPEDDPCFVTLNTQRVIKPHLIYDECVFYHPVFNLAALQGQHSLAELNGKNSTWFCGAWMRNGFHEDGLATGIEVARRIMARSSTMLAAE